MAIHKEKINPEDDLGFGTQPVIKSQPVINKDGTINVKRTGLPFFTTTNNYHSLITMSWRKFWLIVFTCYFTVNIIFALVYFSLGPDVLDGKSGNTNFDRFMDAFFFSAQTISTVGYGHISPRGMIPNTIAALESMMGLLAFALATGLLYGRFSRPSAKIMYSSNVLIAPYKDGGTGLMFRLANERRNILIDLEMEVVFSYNDEENGKTVRKFFQLELERKRVSILTLNWTIVHPLDENSPIKDITPEELQKTQAGLTVSLKTFDDTFSQTVHSRTSYQFDNFVWGAKFKPAFERDETGRVVLDLSSISAYDLVH
jgi:inward rectifier potassium channel